MIATKLIAWYQKNQRDLPFRKTNDPYAIWVSEIMAQQTRIDTMIPYYHRWLNQFPTIEACAEAEVDDILKAWEGLGYYRRARFLHQGCQYLMKYHQGIFPDTHEEIAKIPGIGPYTSAAIASIAFGISVPAIDGNVLRVVSRLRKINSDISKESTKKEVYSLCYDWMQSYNASQFTQGMMEIGALICTPSSPKCNLCPLQSECASYNDQTMLDYPVKPMKKKPSEHHYDLYLIYDDTNLLVSYDDEDGLMQGMVRLPMVQSTQTAPFDRVKVATFKHVYSHKIWYCTVYTASPDSFSYSSEHYQWMPKAKISSIAWITAAKKALAYIEK
ncbi:MAG TPA: A/G-specific adenine glycosylase [Erysipelotrichaceae bacterium]|nr:A/G-specific adenine glycosylase [Erysipelotrichaceae bacterium]